MQDDNENESRNSELDFFTDQTSNNTSFSFAWNMNCTLDCVSSNMLRSK